MAVLAHRKKKLHGAGLDALRETLAAAGVVLLGNVGRITGGVPAFDDADPADGLLEVGVTTASGVLQWARTPGRMTFGRSDRSPFIRITRARKVSVKLARSLPVELDGGARGGTKSFKAEVAPGALIVCVPRRPKLGA